MLEPAPEMFAINNALTTELQSDAETPNQSKEMALDPVSFLDPTTDNEYEDIGIPVGTVADNLIKDAKWHKAFRPLFKLHAVHNYLELLEHYR